MASYCTSDIHGYDDAFFALLQELNLKDDDTLYVLGDVIDRGPNGIKLLQAIMDMPNVKMLLGNHEHMMLQYFDPSMIRWIGGRLVLLEDAEDGSYRQYLWSQSKRLWDNNYNHRTLSAFMRLDGDHQRSILEYLRKLPSYMNVEVNGRRFYLVHGFPGSTTYDEVWSRPENKNSRSPVPDATVIIGHTPVAMLEAPTEKEQNRYFMDLEASGENMQILVSPGGWIDIDCGLSYPVPGRALACLCLDTMEQIYICP